MFDSRCISTIDMCQLRHQQPGVLIGNVPCRCCDPVVVCNIVEVLRPIPRVGCRSPTSPCKPGGVWTRPVRKSYRGHSSLDKFLYAEQVRSFWRSYDLSSHCGKTGCGANRAGSRCFVRHLNGLKTPSSKQQAAKRFGSVPVMLPLPFRYSASNTLRSLLIQTPVQSQGFSPVSTESSSGSLWRCSRVGTSGRNNDKIWRL
jgi:hypothetical protein